MFTIKKTILSVAAVASSVYFLSSCGSSEIANPKNLAAEIGVAKVSGKFVVDTDASNNADLTLPYDSLTKFDNNFPAGVIFITATYMQSDVNPVDATGGTPYAVLKKSVSVPVGADGKYSFEVPASGKGTNLEFTVNTFDGDYKILDADGPALSTVTGATFTQKYVYKSYDLIEMRVYPGNNTMPNTEFKKTTLL